jgi:hypothetical protein
MPPVSALSPAPGPSSMPSVTLREATSVWLRIALLSMRTLI